MAKYFARLSSERAEKHQIGNSYIKLQLFTGSKEDSRPLGELSLHFSGDRHILTFEDENGTQIIKTIPEEATNDSRQPS